MAENKKRKKKKVAPKKKVASKTTTKVNLNKRGVNVQRKHTPSGISYGFSANKGGYKGVNIAIPITKRSNKRG